MINKYLALLLDVLSLHAGLCSGLLQLVLQMSYHLIPALEKAVLASFFLFFWTCNLHGGHPAAGVNLG